MKRLLILALVLTAACSGGPVAEEVAPSAQAVTNFGYPIGALQVSRNQPASEFITPSQFPARAFGGVQAQIARMSYGAVNAPVFYASQGLVHLPFQSGCGQDPTTNARTILAAACHQYLQATHRQWTGTAHIWIQFPYRLPDMNECPFVGPISAISGKINGSEGCSGMPVNGGWTVGGAADGSADLTPQPPDGAEWGEMLTHEILHSTPNNMVSNGGVISGLNAFVTGHDGHVGCPAGQLLSGQNAACAVDSNLYAGGQFLALYPDVNFTHRTALNEPWDYKVDVGWVGQQNVRTLASPSAATGMILNANEKTPVNGLREVYMPRPQFDSFERAIFLEFRRDMWIGGCDPNAFSTTPPCTTVNAPGVYAWLEDAKTFPNSHGGYYMVQWSTSPSDTTYRHLRPLPVGVDVVLEPGVTVRVTGQGNDFALVNATVQ